MWVKGAVDRLSTLVNRWSSHRRELCSDIKLFSTLTERELRHIAPALHHRSYLEGEVIFDEGERGQAVYFVLGGAVTLRHALGDGRRVQLQFEKGDLFGVTALLLDEPRAAQALARTNCQLAIFFRSDLQRLLDTREPSASKIGLEIARYLARLLLKVALDADRPPGV
jgi:CRP/FNR family transcriptional regulator, cyclic AMP receptor protein